MPINRNLSQADEAVVAALQTAVAAAIQKGRQDAQDKYDQEDENARQEALKVLAALPARMQEIIVKNGLTPGCVVYETVARVGRSIFPYESYYRQRLALYLEQYLKAAKYQNHRYGASERGYYELRLTVEVPRTAEA